MSVKRRRGARGQGLAEYGLIIMLAAVVTIAAAFAIGLAVQRVYGIVAGALGTNGSSDKTVIVITQATCVVVPVTMGGPFTSMWVTGTFNKPIQTHTCTDINNNPFICIDNLTASTNLTYGTALNGLDAPVSTGSGTFRWNPVISNAADSSVCPKAVVIQSNKGDIAASPVCTSINNTNCP